MQRLKLLGIMACIGLLASPATAGTNEPGPPGGLAVNVVNPVPLPVTGDLTVTNEPGVMVLNDETDPVPVTVQPDGLAVNVSTVYRFVGFTAARTDGGAYGHPGIYALCQNEFGSAARLCATDEFFKSTNVEAPPFEPIWLAWVEPHIIAAYPDPEDPTRTLYVEPFAQKAIHGIDLNCLLWGSPHEAYRGTAIRRIGDDEPAIAMDVIPVGCEFELPVTCCAPTN